VHISTEDEASAVVFVTMYCLPLSLHDLHGGGRGMHGRDAAQHISG
jgi:hypothetical protein